MRAGMSVLPVTAHPRAAKPLVSPHRACSMGWVVGRARMLTLRDARVHFRQTASKPAKLEEQCARQACMFTL